MNEIKEFEESVERILDEEVEPLLVYDAESSKIIRKLGGTCIPSVVSPTGTDDETISEVLTCDSISGGKDYIDNMPRKLSLIRWTPDGEYRATYYIQVCTNEQPNNNR